MTFAVLALVISALLLSLANGDGKGELEFTLFQNPKGTNQRGTVCDFLGSCDYYFEVCISKDHVTAESGPAGCNILYRKSNTINDQNNWDGSQFQHAFTRITYEVKQTSVANDLKVRITVFDEDKFKSHETVEVYRFVLRGVSSNNQWISFVEARGDRALQFRIRATCNAHYFGDQCLRFCVPDDQNYSRCDSNGTKVCQEGRTGLHCQTIQQVTQIVSTFDSATEMRTRKAKAADNRGTIESSEADNTSTNAFQERWLASQNKANEQHESDTFLGALLASLLASLVLLSVVCFFAYRFHHYRVKPSTAERPHDEKEAVYNTSILGKMNLLSSVLEDQRTFNQRTSTESRTVGLLTNGIQTNEQGLLQDPEVYSYTEIYSYTPITVSYHKNINNDENDDGLYESAQV